MDVLWRLLPAPLLLTLLTACPERPAEAPPQPIENPSLGIVLTSLPRGFELEINEAETLRLLGEGERGPGVVTIEVSPILEYGVNVHEMARRQPEEYEAMPDGEFLGVVQLRGPLGAVMTARGRYTVDGEHMEESRLLAPHPTRNAELTLSYTYPVGNDSRERMDQLIALLGRLEGFPDAPAAVPEPEG